MERVAINIETKVWEKIISSLRSKGWWVTAKYYGFDAGIDDDFLILRKGFKKIVFGWTNWLEGEIKCNDEIFDYLQKENDIKFQFGKATILKTSLIHSYRAHSLPLWVIKTFNLL